MLHAFLLTLIIAESLVFSPSTEKNANNKMNLVWHWEDDFSEPEMQKVKKWIELTSVAIENSIGVYPFDVHVHVYRRDNSGEPVPWAHTQRGENQSVHFYIDPDYSLESFLGDWTAPHEISHLSIPFVGNSNAWFAEGYASFMQYQVMVESGIYSPNEVQEKYMEKITSVKPFYKSNSNLITVAQNLRREYKFPQMYWGGATYFVRLDQELKESGSSLLEIIHEYLECCRLEDDSMEDVIESWDKLIGKPLASKLFSQYKMLPAHEMIDVEYPID